MSRRQPSSLVSNGISAATVALNIAGAATDAVPIAKQIINSAAHISTFAEKIQKKREGMYMLIQKTEIYSTQIDIALAGRVVDTSLQRRLERLYAVFLKIEALMDEAGSKDNALTRVWRNVVTKPNHAETLIIELDREIQLFQLLMGMQLSLVADDTARVVAAGARYDGQIRILRDCDIAERSIIRQCRTDQGTIVWASARVDGLLMVIRYLDSTSTVDKDHSVSAEVAQWTPPHEYLESVKKLSTVVGSHPHIVRLFGRHTQGPAAVLRAGTLDLYVHLKNMRGVKDTGENVAVKHLRLAYQMLDASAHLVNVHGLKWVRESATVDENGEPYIGLFNDIVRANPSHLRSGVPLLYWNMFQWFNYQNNEETGIVEQVHDSQLHAIIAEQLRNGSGTDLLQRVWGAVRQEKLLVMYRTSAFPIISGNVPLSQEMIARARLYFERYTREDDLYWNCIISFVRHVLAGGGANTPSQIAISIWRIHGDYTIHVETCTNDDSLIRYNYFWISIPAGCTRLAAVARAAGLPDDVEHSWNPSGVFIYRN